MRDGNEPRSDGTSAVFTRRERWEVAAIFAGILLATLLGFAALFVIGRVYGILIGLGVLSYTLGLRHGVDADHICAIDNTTRKLLQQGKRPHTVGTWFSLGHSTVVLGMLVGLVLAARWIVENLPAFESTGNLVGTAVSGGFLYLIAFVNLLIVLEIYAIFRKLRAGVLDAQALEAQLDQRGFMNRYFHFLFRLVNEPWQIYPIGVLFGLGFDTATEVTLIAITVTVGTAAAGFPLWMILILPFLFTCGMALTDTSDGIGMRFAYGWAFLNPIRKVYYNLTMTIISVLVAFVIGTVELLGVLVRELGLSGGPFGIWNSLGWLNGGGGAGPVDLWGYVGIGVVALFLGCWLVAMAVYRWKHYEEVGFRAPPGASPISPS
ncbi:MAG TPA: HoxN/HupN/NixA family nickel/cobalt transporter [Thermoplasmata archaeon]|nr:HoxN/HupN/NixA family nickel/cobalt transporter [Thermoplasmata archaeon]